MRVLFSLRGTCIERVCVCVHVHANIRVQLNAKKHENGNRDRDAWWCASRRSAHVQAQRMLCFVVHVHYTPKHTKCVCDIKFVHVVWSCACLYTNSPRTSF